MTGICVSIKRFWRVSRATHVSKAIPALFDKEKEVPHKEQICQALN